MEVPSTRNSALPVALPSPPSPDGCAFCLEDYYHLPDAHEERGDNEDEDGGGGATSSSAPVDMTISAATPCGHVFHTRCWERYEQAQEEDQLHHASLSLLSSQHPRCPVCKQPVEHLTRLYCTLMTPPSATDTSSRHDATEEEESGDKAATSDPHAPANTASVNSSGKRERPSTPHTTMQQQEQQQQQHQNWKKRYRQSQTELWNWQTKYKEAIESHELERQVTASLLLQQQHQQQQLRLPAALPTSIQLHTVLQAAVTVSTGTTMIAPPPSSPSSVTSPLLSGTSHPVFVQQSDTNNGTTGTQGQPTALSHVLQELLVPQVSTASGPPLATTAATASTTAAVVTAAETSPIGITAIATPHAIVPCLVTTAPPPPSPTYYYCDNNNPLLWGWILAHKNDSNMAAAVASTSLPTTRLQPQVHSRSTLWQELLAAGVQLGGGEVP